MHASKPFIVAEISANHLNDLGRALALVDAAAESGADAVKLQTYKPEGMTLPSLPRLATGPWAGQSLWQLYAQAMTPWEWHEALFERAQARGIQCFSSPFSLDAVDFLETLNCPIYKIASPEIVWLELIGKAAGTEKPLILSTGMTFYSEIEQALGAAAGAASVALLKCVSAYPASPKDFNLLTIEHMAHIFPHCEIGLSDHSLGLTVAVAAAALGATIVEKHLTLSRADGGPDAGFSMEPDEFKAMAKACRIAAVARGGVHYGATLNEDASLCYRRSLWVVRPLVAGETLTREHIGVLRPADGLAPRELPFILGRKAAHDLDCGMPLQWSDLA